MGLTREEYESFRVNQYCDNTMCGSYSLVNAGNIKVHSLVTGQCFCNVCKSKPFSVRKGTMFYGLQTDMNKIVKVLTLLSSGMGQNAVCRIENVRAETVRSWITLASKQVIAFTKYMQQNMQLEQVQIDEFWSFIRKKRNI